MLYRSRHFLHRRRESGHARGRDHRARRARSEAARAGDAELKRADSPRAQGPRPSACVRTPVSAPSRQPVAGVGPLGFACGNPGAPCAPVPGLARMGGSARRRNRHRLHGRPAPPPPARPRLSPLRDQAVDARRRQAGGPRRHGRGARRRRAQALQRPRQRRPALHRARALASSVADRHALGPMSRVRGVRDEDDRGHHRLGLSGRARRARVRGSARGLPVAARRAGLRDALSQAAIVHPSARAPRPRPVRPCAGGPHR